MDIAAALSAAVERSGWSLARIGMVCGVSETSVRTWLAGKKVPNGRAIVVLERQLPIFRDLLDAEFARLEADAA